MKQKLQKKPQNFKKKPKKAPLFIVKNTLFFMFFVKIEPFYWVIFIHKQAILLQNVP